ncbi:MAG: hypothetical protein QOG75_4360 [Mycobacterium sp.]|jgi:hypothetical protein|nr:hypothetical protein [Mycobacterium sp.]
MRGNPLRPGAFEVPPSRLDLTPLRPGESPSCVRGWTHSQVCPVDTCHQRCGPRSGRWPAEQSREAAQCSISKTRVATILREQGITIRRQGLNDEQVREAATLYAAGNSLAKIGARFDVSHTTVAAALRQQGIQLRLRPGWR